MKACIVALMNFCLNFSDLLKSKSDIFFKSYHSYFNLPYDEAVHDIRVYSRKLYVPLLFLEKLLKEKESHPYISLFREVRRKFSEYRDHEVMLFRLTGMAETVNEEHRIFHQKLLELTAEYLEKQKHLIDESLRNVIFPEPDHTVNVLCLKLRNFQHNHPDDYIKKILKTLKMMILKHERSVGKYHRSLKNGNIQENIHRLRIAIKKLRYLLEFCSELGVFDASKQVKKYSKLQKLLGTYCDDLMIRNHLKSTAKQFRNDHNDGGFSGYCNNLSQQFGTDALKLQRKVPGISIAEYFIFAEYKKHRK